MRGYTGKPHCHRQWFQKNFEGRTGKVDQQQSAAVQLAPEKRLRRRLCFFRLHQKTFCVPACFALWRGMLFYWTASLFWKRFAILSWIAYNSAIREGLRERRNAAVFPVGTAGGRALVEVYPPSGPPAAANGFYRPVAASGLQGRSGSQGRGLWRLRPVRPGRV